MEGVSILIESVGQILHDIRVIPWKGNETMDLILVWEYFLLRAY